MGLVFVALLLGIIVGVLVARPVRRALRRVRARRRVAAPALAEAPTPTRTRLVVFDPVVPRGTRATTFDTHDPRWQSEMGRVGRCLQESGVGAVVFCHGTFVGDDPAALGVAARKIPRFGARMSRAVRDTTRRLLEGALGDFGNFGEPYARLFEAGLGGSIPCTSFVWSSENHHAGRFVGAVQLARVLATHALAADRAGGGRPTILALGHSHAGQLFALLTRMIADSDEMEVLGDLARARGIDARAVAEDLLVLGRTNLDLVTFGAPARYGWVPAPNIRALHIVHARERRTREGVEPVLVDVDTMRRLGAGRTDFPATSPFERNVNQRLDQWLEPGTDARTWLPALRRRLHLPTHGDVVLVDYASRESWRGAIASGLGHGVYTRFDAMLFHARLVAEQLYGAEPAS